VQFYIVAGNPGVLGQNFLGQRFPLSIQLPYAKIVEQKKHLVTPTETGETETRIEQLPEVLHYKAYRHLWPVLNALQVEQIEIPRPVDKKMVEVKILVIHPPLVEAPRQPGKIMNNLSFLFPLRAGRDNRPLALDK
jgi:hypothetical protein